MMEFLIGILASFTAAVIFVITSKFLPQRTRVFIFFLFSKLFHCGISYIYENEGKAAKDILFHASRSKNVRVLSIRGFRLTSEDRPLSNLLRTDFNVKKLEVILADPESTAIKERSKDFVDFGATYVAPVQ